MHVLLSVLLIAFKFKFWQIYWTSPNRTCIPPPIPKNCKTIKWPALSNFDGGAWGLVRKMLASLWCQDSHLHTWVATQVTDAVADDKDCTWQEQGANWLGAHKTEIHQLMYILFFWTYEFRKTQNMNNYRSRIIDIWIKGTIKWLKWCKHNMLHILPCCTDQTLLKDI